MNISTVTQRARHIHLLTGFFLITLLSGCAAMEGVNVGVNVPIGGVVNVGANKRIGESQTPTQAPKKTEEQSEGSSESDE